VPVFATDLPQKEVEMIQLSSLPANTVIEAFLAADGLEFLQRFQKKLQARVEPPPAFVPINGAWNLREENQEELAMMRMDDDGGPCLD
jgi:hypothetical protein